MNSPRVCAYLASWSFPVEFQAAVERPSSRRLTNVKIVTDEKSTQFRGTAVACSLVVCGCAGNGARVGGRQDAVHGSSPEFRAVQLVSLSAGPAPSRASFRHPIRSGCAFRRILKYLSGSGLLGPHPDYLGGIRDSQRSVGGFRSCGRRWACPQMRTVDWIEVTATARVVIPA